jgi:hypothetical protein
MVIGMEYDSMSNAVERRRPPPLHNFNTPAILLAPEPRAAGEPVSL